ncbi:MAG: isoprenylcysteine carboxylmethyltransferase family protein [Archangium sp.]
MRWLDRAGGLLFRARSFLPLPLIYLVVSQSWDAHIAPGMGGAQVDEALNLIGLVSCLFGAAIRFVTIGLVPPGSSSQSRNFSAPTLTTTGPYSVVRHPLYVGNFFITAGLLLIVHEPWAYAVGFGYWALSHLLIVVAEERILREQHGETFEAWRRAVPGWVPAFSKWQRGTPTFSWKRAIQREVNPLVAWGLGATLLLMWELFVRRALPGALGKKYLAVVIVFLVLLIANKVWKKLSPP